MGEPSLLCKLWMVAAAAQEEVEVFCKEGCLHHLQPERLNSGLTR